MNLRNMIIKIHICLIAFCFISGIKAQNTEQYDGNHSI